MEYYLKPTKNLRQPNCDFLFISFKKPNKSVSAQTISRWIREMLIKCGVKDFSGYSTRHASTSAASRNGINVNIIKIAAG